VKVECVSISKWVRLPTHIEVEFRYLQDGRLRRAHRRFPLTTIKTPHVEAREIQKFKQEKLKESNHVAPEFRPVRHA
jgi:hypothetical protein